MGLYIAMHAQGYGSRGVGAETGSREGTRRRLDSLKLNVNASNEFKKIKRLLC